jgi:hypothetical protein
VTRLSARTALAASAVVVAAAALVLSPIARGAPNAAAPAPEHARLASLAGEWDLACTFQGAERPPTPAKATIRSVLGGRFLLEEQKGSMFGEPTESLHLLGFNADTKTYEGTWAWTGSPSTMRLAGPAGDGKTITLSGGSEGAKGTQRFRVELEMASRDAFTVRLVGIAPDGSDGPTLTTRYSRAK